jgi:serine/threonine protein kinase
MVDLLETFHGKGYIHCDLKPDNIMIGDFKENLENMNKIYLIDFGLASKFLDDNGNHIKFCQDIPFKGNLIFSSKNAFAKVTLSRRDDIISLMYMIIYLIETK